MRFIPTFCIVLITMYMVTHVPIAEAKTGFFNMIFQKAAEIGNGVQAVTVPYSDCGKSGDHVKIQNVTANSWPPQKGETLTLNVTGTVDEQVTKGTYNLQVSYYGITIINQNGDLTDFIKLPAGPGEIYISYSEELPSSSPSGPYVVEITAADQNSQELLCMTVKFSLSMENDDVKPMPLPHPIPEESFEDAKEALFKHWARDHHRHPHRYGRAHAQ